MPSGRRMYSLQYEVRRRVLSPWTRAFGIRTDQPYFYPDTYMPLRTYRHMYDIHIFVYLSICPSIHLSTYPSIYLSIYPSIYLSIHPFVYMTI